MALWPRTHTLVIVHELVDYRAFIRSFLCRCSPPVDHRCFPLEGHIVAPGWFKHHILAIHAQFEARWALRVSH